MGKNFKKVIALILAVIMINMEIAEAMKNIEVQEIVEI